MNKEEIKSLRAGLGLSQKDFGSLLGIEQATVSRLEQGEYSASGSLEKLLLILRDTPQLSSFPTPIEAVAS